MSNRKSNRSNKFKCLHCGLFCSSQETLIDHARDTLEIDKDSSCLDCLFQCEFCGKLWVNENSLARHMASNENCKRIQHLEQNMSKLDRDVVVVEPEYYKPSDLKKDLPKRMSSSIAFDFDTRYNRDDFMVNSRINGLEVTIAQSGPRMNKKARRSQKMSCPKFIEIDAPVLPQDIMQSSQVHKLTKCSIDLHIDKHRDAYNGYLSSHACKFFASMIPLCPKFNQGSLEGSIREIMFDLKNTSARTQLESGLQSLPGFDSTYHFSDVSDEQIIMFILKHNESALEASEEIELEERDDTGSFISDHSSRDNTNSDSDDASFEARNDSDAGDAEEVEQVRVTDEAFKAIRDHVEQTRHESLYDHTELAMIELLEILQKSGAPLGLFNKLTSWCKRSADCFSNEKLTSRDEFIKRLSKKVYGEHMERALRPKVMRHQLPSGKSIDVTSFSFKAKLASILMNEELIQPKNLLLNPDNIFVPPKDLDHFEDLNSGWWWKETWEEVCRHPDEILCPIILFLDAGKVTKRMSVEPLTFTIGLLKRHVRNLSQSWRTLGYIESLSNTNAEDEDQEDDELHINGKSMPSKSTTAKMNDYHSMLSLLLFELKSLQGPENGMHWELCLGGKTNRVVLKFAIQVVIGDCKGNNVLCGQFGGHSILSKQLCRDCNVAPMDSDNPNHICTFVSINDVRGKTKKELKMRSMHKIQNCFDEMYFGARTSSIFNCTPPEPLHGVLLGTIKYLFEEFERLVPNKTMDLINHFVISWYKKRRFHQSQNNMPSIVNLQGGVTNCDTLTAKQQYSRVFAIFLSLHNPTIFKSLAFDKRSSRVKEDGSDTFHFVELDPIGVPKARKWVGLVYESLIMYQFLMKDSHLKHDFLPQINPETANGLSSECIPQLAMRKYMTKYKELIGGRPGHGLMITKFHQLLHYTRQIQKDGSIENIDSGICEGLAVGMYKNLVNRTQKKQLTLNRDIANRHVESILIEEAVRLTKPLRSCTWNTNENVRGEDHDDKLDTLQGTRFELRYPKYPSENVQVTWSSKTKRIGFSAELCSMLTHRLFLNTGDGGCLTHDSTVKGYTEFIDGSGITYRAHPNYRSQGEWNDWCLMRWEGNDEPLPTKIIAFLDLTDCKLMQNEDQNYLQEWIDEEGEGAQNLPFDRGQRVEYLSLEKWVVIQSSVTAQELVTQRRERAPSEMTFCVDTKISKRFRLENKYRVLPLSAMCGHAYCIEVDQCRDNDKEYIHVVGIEKWGDLFIKDNLDG